MLIIAVFNHNSGQSSPALESKSELGQEWWRGLKFDSRVSVV